ncbi:Crp/Fnr family transcriptional regulator [Listeria monocytogenes]|nr:Crp/Fnr family transcriptional regulator [Listeria monocytogenes]
MSYSFDYRKYICMMSKYNLHTKEVFLPAKSSTEDFFKKNKEHIFLIKSGIIKSFLKTNTEQLHSILGKGFFVGYYTIFEEEQTLLEFETLTDCELYLFHKKDVELSVSLLPEGLYFQNSIMKMTAKNWYYKSLLSFASKQDRLKLAFEILSELHGEKLNHDWTVLPKAINSKTVRTYCCVSKGFFYKQLQKLMTQGIIVRKDKQWIVNVNIIQGLDFRPKN